jgi:hypothetical protein
MTRRSFRFFVLAAALSTALVACGPANSGMLDERTCGQVGPVRILETSEAQRPNMFARVGDRVLVRDKFDVVHTVGACGESPVTLEVWVEDVLHVDEPGQRIWIASQERVGWSFPAIRRRR